MSKHTLSAAHGLAAQLDDGRLRISFGTADWLGPGTLAVQSPLVSPDRLSSATRVAATDGSDDLGGFHELGLTWAAEPQLSAGVRAYSDLGLVVLRLAANQELHGFANGNVAALSLAWHFQPAQRLAGGVPEGTRSYAHQFAEFALPVNGDANAAGFFLTPHRPPLVAPLLLIAPDGRTLLIAPLDHFHEQMIAVPADAEHAGDGIACGWHGDLNDIPAGFATEMALLAADGPRAALSTWAGILLRRNRTQRLGRYADEMVGKLSYWTDNGAVYYYRTEPDCDYTTTLERVVADLEHKQVPIRTVQIDSWFYPHQYLRPVSSEGAPIVPPSGMMTWEPREDLFPNGFRDLQQRLGGRPTAFHSRHFSAHSPYNDGFATWKDGDYAHPSDPTLYDLLMASAASWGANTYEQDWLVESFFGVRGMRAAPGRARAWQEAMDQAAGANGMHLQWCMATPADFMQTVNLRNVASIRTCGDYRYMFDNGANWVWFLHTNALARALGLWPFKDVFLSHGKTSLSEGEPYAEVEALLSALSGGPVGIGDQLGCTNRDLVMRCCRNDGVLIKPDVPLAALDRCFARNAFFHHSLLVGEAHNLHPAGRWLYLASFNASHAKQPIEDKVSLADLGALRPDGDVIVYDWRQRTWQRLGRDGAWNVDLGYQEWDYRIVCPLLAGDITVFGDADKYASVGDQRVGRIRTEDGAVCFDLHGSPGEVVAVSGYAARRLREVTAWDTRGSRRLDGAAAAADSSAWDAATHGWTLRVQLGDTGYARVTLRT